MSGRNEHHSGGDTGMGHHAFLAQPMNVFLCIVDDTKRHSFLSGHDRKGSLRCPFFYIHLVWKSPDKLCLGDHPLIGMELGLGPGLSPRNR